MAEVKEIKPKVNDFDKYHEDAYSKAMEVAKKRGYVEQVEANKGKVIVRRTGEIKVSEGGILLPSNNAKKVNQGLVISAGPGSAYRINDKVIFGEYAGVNQIEMNGEYLLVLNEEECCGSLTRKAI